MSRFLKKPSEGQVAPPSIPAQQGAQRSGIATIAFVMGVIAFIGRKYPGYIFAGIAIVLGLIALFIILRSKGKVGGLVFAILGTAAGLFSLVSTAMVGNSWKRELADEVPANAVLTQAEQNLHYTKSEEIGYGNVELARALATSMSGELEMTLAEELDASSAARFITHCELGEETIAFLIKVPNIRKYDAASKKLINKLIWVVALNQLENANVTEGTALAVATKGLVLYDEIMIGKVASPPADLSDPITYAELKVRTFGKKVEKLYPFFLEPETHSNFGSENSPDPESDPVQNDDSTDAAPAKKEPVNKSPFVE